MKEIIVEPLGRNKDQVAAMRLADQVDCITVAPQFLPLSRARKIRNRRHRKYFAMPVQLQAAQASSW
jgi:hypothetical protein